MVLMIRHFPDLVYAVGALLGLAIVRVSETGVFCELVLRLRRRLAVVVRWRCWVDALER